MTIIRTFLHSGRFVAGFLILLAVLIFGILGPTLSSKDPLEMAGSIYQKPDDKFLLGTDNFGRDVLTELKFGTRTSLTVGLLGGVMATAIGLSVGTLAGFRGGWVEELLMGLTNVLITIPTIVILILLSVAITVRSAWVMSLIIGVTAWPWTARAVRAQTSSLRTRPHLDIARLSGSSGFAMAIIDVLPYMASYVFMALILQVSSAILSEATLSMLGLGPTNTISLGVMLNWALLWESVRTGAWWAFLPPVVMLSVTSFALLAMNSGMDEIFNPRLRRR